MLCAHPYHYCDFELMPTHPEYRAGGANCWSECLRCRKATHRYPSKHQAHSAVADVEPIETLPRWTVPPAAV